MDEDDDGLFRGGHEFTFPEVRAASITSTAWAAAPAAAVERSHERTDEARAAVHPVTGCRSGRRR
ncbi:hypothetical protein GCM10009530_51420 [Microbispora corallina]|uniref:Uncharacterized protein n=1 Tax=Microbispora corallina TaxID=83302 RepID=A0ABQ4G6M6_9ACTN|nr:hypothetical protein Mco01_57350 [Microbispora corallina]